MQYVFYIFVGIALVILTLCVLLDKLNKNNQEIHYQSKDKKIEICKCKDKPQFKNK